MFGHLLFNRSCIGIPQDPAQRRCTGDARAFRLKLSDEFCSMLLRPVRNIQNRGLPAGETCCQNGQQIGPGKTLALLRPDIGYLCLLGQKGGLEWFHRARISLLLLLTTDSIRWNSSF